MGKDKKFVEIQGSSVDPFTGVTTSSDMSTAIAYKIPQGYHERVAQIWKNYDSDDGFSYLIDRISQYGVNGTSWRCKKKDEELFWNEWARMINSNLDNTIPGLDEIQKWNMKHLALGGMAVNQWEWGDIEIGGHTFQVPIKWTIHNELAVNLRKKKLIFGGEKIYVKLSAKQANAIKNFKTYSQSYATDDIKNNYITLNNAFALKYNYSPADNTRDDTIVNDSVSPSSYPTPPFLTCNEFIAMRKQLRAMDMQISDGFINKILLWKIGDKDNPPSPAKKDKDGKIIEKSSVAAAREMIEASNSKTLKQLFMPYYVDLDIKTPDIQPLLAQEKYAEATVQLLWKFGILVAPPGDSRLNFTDINTKNFEQLIDFIRLQHYRRFIEGIVCKAIVEKNKEKLTEIPSLNFNALNTSDEKFKEGIRSLMKMGKISTRTGLQIHKVNKDVEVANIKDEIDEDKFKDKKWAGTSEKEMFDINSPVAFRQQAETLEQPDVGKKGVKTSDRKGIDEGGHPENEKNKTEED